MCVGLVLCFFGHLVCLVARTVRSVARFGSTSNIAGTGSVDAEDRSGWILGRSVVVSETHLTLLAAGRWLGGRTHTRVDRRVGADNECKVKSHLALAQINERKKCRDE